MIRYFSVLYEVVVDWIAARLGHRRNWCRAILDRLPIEPNEVADLFVTSHRESAKTIASMMRQARGDFALFHAMKRDYNTQAVRVIAPLMIRPEFQIGVWRGINNKLANVEQSPESLILRYRSNAERLDLVWLGVVRMWKIERERIDRTPPPTELFDEIASSWRKITSGQVAAVSIRWCSPHSGYLDCYERVPWNTATVFVWASRLDDWRKQWTGDEGLISLVQARVWGEEQWRVLLTRDPTEAMRLAVTLFERGESSITHGMRAAPLPLDW